MRKICKSELPEIHSNTVIIKSRERNYHYQHICAIEKTLEACRVTRLKFESELAEMKIISQKEGFSAGLKIFFEQLIRIISFYQQRQSERFLAYKSFLQSQAEKIIYDPDFIGIIIAKLQKEFNEDSKIIFVFPDEFRHFFSDHLDCLYGNSLDVTIKNKSGPEIIRFPYEALLGEMFESTDKYISDITDKCNEQFTNVLDEMIEKLEMLKRIGTE
ncbi:hypothetical protein EZW88_23795 [Salmonella enterica subsp. enterica serovar Bredeney]|nr:hypothetical protein [Salmonella enterica subsp. enterica serovar Bredeney]EDO5628554.1 hypothetical protein [Salmonella enterica]EDR9399012.1 hypothetical protein [Salmonella enterica subsp. enterica]EDT6893100.1 hypothetical protein [Salmonella enterica subsp. enterica serovar Javiana]HCM6292646.1 hypothetical protein [Salmonella enterica subsp. enterica serovar 16:l,v:-]